jgi:hypothetical protein
MSTSNAAMPSRSLAEKEAVRGLVLAKVNRISHVPASIRHWTLDAPRTDQAFALAQDELPLQGWLLSTEPTPATPPILLVRNAEGDTPSLRHPFNNGRPDVITRVLGEPVVGHPQLRCGFSVSVPMPTGAVDIGFELPDGTVFWAATLTLEAHEPAVPGPGTPAPGVIEGTDGWLFLDNDTNRSVDQFTGRLRLDDDGLARWRSYLGALQALATAQGARTALLIAPSKEEVLPAHYPHARGAQTVLDQVLALPGPDDVAVVDGRAVLAAATAPEQGFKRADTHWTDRGAWWVTLATLAALALDAEAARRLCAGDHYRLQPYAGDLGVKLTPARHAPTEFLDGPAPEAGARFDNRLPNIGRVLVFECEAPCYPLRLLLFGASSAYPMLKYLKRLFRRTVFVHSAAGVDPRVVAHERPDVLLCQSTSRFLVTPPRCDFSLADAVRAKQAQFATEAAAPACTALTDPIDDFYALLPDAT